jgi:hypothetical protein
MKPAQIYAKAIDLMEGMERGYDNHTIGFACNAIETAQGRSFLAEPSRAAQAFRDLFQPEPAPFLEHHEGFFGLMSSRATHERIVALGFMLAMVEAGDA